MMKEIFEEVGELQKIYDSKLRVQDLRENFLLLHRLRLVASFARPGFPGYSSLETQTCK